MYNMIKMVAISDFSVMTILKVRLKIYEYFKLGGILFVFGFLYQIEQTYSQRK